MSVLLAAALLLAQPDVDCEAFAAALPVTFEVSVRPLSREEIFVETFKPEATETDAHFDYLGHGVAVSSTDPRFNAIVIEPEGPVHPCGPRIQAPTGWNALDENLSSAKAGFWPTPATLWPGAVRAAERNLAPVVPGYDTVASWPLGLNGLFLGLMTPSDPSNSATLMVAFGPQRTSKTVVLGRLHLPFGMLNVVPDPHGSDQYVNLDGVADDHTLYSVTLRMSHEQVEALSEEVGLYYQPPGRAAPD